MTIKVTRMGRLPANDPFAGTCNHCRTAIECLRSDGEYHPGDQREPEGHLDVACPTCGSTIHAYPQKPEVERWRDR